MSHDTLESRLWYVRRRGQILGPFSVTELRKLRERGNLAAFDTVSDDRFSWVPVNSLLDPPAAAAVGGGSSTANAPIPGYSTGGRDMRGLASGLLMLTIGRVIECIAALIMLSGFVIAYTNGKMVVMNVVVILTICATIAYQILLLIGYGMTCGAPSEAASKPLAVTSLIFQIVDLLLAGIVLVLVQTYGTGILNRTERIDSNMSTLITMMFVLRTVIWVPAILCHIEWLKSFARRTQEQDATGLMARSVLAQAPYFYVLYALENLILLLMYVFYFIASEPLTNLNNRLALILFILSVAYIMIATVVSVWLISFLYMSWRSAARLAR